jgi:hypothetical protein
VQDDRHPCTPVAIGRVSLQKTAEDIVQYSSGQVNVIDTEEYTVCHPTPATKHTFHPGQEHAPEKELLSQNSVEHGANHEQGQEPPRIL